MRYQDAMEYVEECGRFGVVPGLDSIRELMKRLGNPQNELIFVHIAGTNGKGSVLAYISTVLTQAGYRTGRFVSPAVFDYRESFQIDGKSIPKAELGRLFGLVREQADAMEADGLPHPTVFEMETALGFLYFRNKKCDIVVLETGMGGLLDTTNVIPAPAVSVLTSIGMDHMAVLGGSLAQIAVHKAGIIKHGSVVVSLKQTPEVMGVIDDACSKEGCRLRIADPAYVSGVKAVLGRQRFNWGRYRNLEIHMNGACQIRNCVIALEALEALREAGFRISEEALREGLAATIWPGRLQVIGRKPLFIADGAHNEDGAEALAEAVRFYFKDKKIIYIIGILKDKEYVKILEKTLFAPAAVICVTPPGPRGLPALSLAGEAGKLHHNVTAADSLEEAVEMAYMLADREDVILAFGSLSYLGELIKTAENRDALRSDTHGKQRED